MKEIDKIKTERDILLVAYKALSEVIFYDAIGEKQSKYFYGVARGILDTTDLALRRAGITAEEICGAFEGESDE